MAAMQPVGRTCSSSLVVAVCTCKNSDLGQMCCGSILSCLCGSDCTPTTATPVCCCSKKRCRQAGDDDEEGSVYEDTLDGEAGGSDSDASDVASGTFQV